MFVYYNELFLGLLLFGTGYIFISNWEDLSIIISPVEDDIRHLTPILVLCNTCIILEAVQSAGRASL